MINRVRSLHELRWRSLAHRQTIGKRATILAMLFVCHSTISAKADACPIIKDEIITDRPDVTNSSVVIPAGSLQIENGVNLSARDGDRLIDGTNTRLRFGIANCFEFLLDTPTYSANVSNPKNSGFSDVAPALKWQISPVPGKSIYPRCLVWRCQPGQPI
jgi:hypothetical protein